MSVRATLAWIALCAVLTSCVPDADRSARADAAFLRVVAAEDARPGGGRDLQTLRDATRSEIAFIRHAAVRALGRLETPALVDDIVPLLDDATPSVRHSAVNALAQAFHTSEDATRAAEILLGRVGVETDPGVRGTIARSLGRLALDRPLRRRVADALVDISREGDADAPPETLIGVALGLEAMVRAHASEGVSARVASRLDELARYQGRSPRDAVSARIRTLAIAALGAARRIDTELAFAAVRDEAWQVGAMAMRHLDAVPPGQRPELLRRAVGSPAVQMVVEAFRYLQGASRSATNCRYVLLGAVSPETGASAPPPVRLLALDALAQPCPDVETQADLLRSVAAGVTDDATPWQPASRALVSLARLLPSEAARLMAAHAEHENPFVRAYAARAATILGEADVLRSLVEDADPNVRTAAIAGLFQLEAHDVDPILVQQLTTAVDPQLILTVADLLEDTPEPEAVRRPALDAFVRISAAERETWRDPRRALLRLVRAVGDARLTSELEPYLEDYDPVVAGDVAAILSEWSGEPYVASPRPVPHLPLPTVEDLRAMDGARVVLHMEAGGTIEIALFPHVATTNAYRFHRLVREGYFDGLTFHRWAPAFVIQGGSPGANEYQGAAAYTRDEVGLASHWRGTVGISTRGHDTGDAQIFVNLVDNVRLDHTYTIVGTVVDGMDVVDSVLDGAVIERAEVVSGDRVAGM